MVKPALILAIVLLIAIPAFAIMQNQAPNTHLIPFWRNEGAGLAYQNLAGTNYLKISTLLPASSEGLINPLLPPSLTVNLIAYYPLDEDSSTSTYDLSGNGNIGTLTNSPTWKTGTGCEFGSCLDFVFASSEYVKVTSPSQNSFSSTQDHSYCLWAKFPSGLTNAYYWLLNFGSTNTGSSLVMTVSGGNYFLVFFLKGGNNLFTSTGTISANVWHELCMTYSGTTKTMSLYIDGALDSNAVNAVIWAGAADPIQIGAWDNAGTAQFFDTGQIDDVRIYNVVLTTAQVNQLYRYGTEYAQTGILPGTPGIGAEAFLPNQIDASVSGTSISWKSEWDTNGGDSGHNIWPIGAEFAPGGNRFMLIYWDGTTWRCSQSNGAGVTSQSITAPSANIIHTFQIVVTTAGSQVDYSIDSVNVCSLVTNIPTGLITPFVEFDATSLTVREEANFWGFGGSL